MTTRHYTVDELTPSQIKVLATIHAVNRFHKQLPEGPVDQHAEGINKASIYALARRDIVVWDGYRGWVRLRPHCLELAAEACTVLEGGR